jgi:hypothetical protein
MFVDMQHEYPAKPRLLAISEIDRAPGNCRKVLDHSRRVGLPAAFISGIHAEVERTLPRKLGIGRDAGG